MKPHIFLLVSVLLAITLVFPVSAVDLTGYMLEPLDTLKTQKIEFNDVYNITYDASTEGNAIMLIHFKVPMDHQVDYIIYTWQEQLPGSASTTWNLSIIPPTTTTSSITFSGETKAYSYLDTNPEFDYFLSGYAKEISTNTSGIIVYNAGYGSFDNSLAIFHPVGSATTNLIYRVDLSSDAPFDADITFAENAAVAKSVSKNWLEIVMDWISLAISLAVFVKDIVLGTFTWIKFLFVDNLLMIVAIYTSINMAVAAATSKNIFKFFGKFFNNQIKLFHFILGLWKTLVDIIAEFRSIFHV
jgi:hypothetical protein